MDTLPIATKHHLIVTTAGGVYTWSNRGSAELFSSSSKGIVTSRNMQIDKDLLAVADSQIVVLHDIEKGMQRTYRLRNQDQGYIRKLFYHPDKQRLFFTTTLQNAVQSFSLQKFEVLDAAPTHPSPPTVFAVSPACDLLVSASTDPPTIYLSRITCKQPPLLFIPNCSSASVVSICFHPTQANVFAIGFEDGTLAAYNASILPVSQSTEERFSYARIYGEISHLTGLHSHTTGASSSAKSPGSERSTAVTVPTISGMQFIGNRRCSTVSVGSDGNCFIVDFHSNRKRVAQVVQNWNVQAAATSLAIVNVGVTLPQTDGAGGEAETDDMLLAIGKSDGTVSVYDKVGMLLATRDFSKDGRILDLEWMQRSKDKQPKPDEQSSDSTLHSSGKHANQPEDVSKIPLSPRLISKDSRSPTGSKIMVKLHVKDPPPDDYLRREKSSMQDADENINHSASSLDGSSISTLENHQPANHQQDIASETNPNVEKLKSRDDGIPTANPEGTIGHRTRSRQSSRTTVRSSGSSSSGKRTKYPVTPSRPVPRPGGKLALRRIESAKGRRTSRASHLPIPTEVVHAVTKGQPQFNHINHEPLRRPNMHLRHRSSRISPLTEAVEPHFQTPSSIPSSPLAATPLQYNRLTRSNWELESRSSVSRSSVYHDPPTKHGPGLTTKTDLRGSSATKMGTVPSGQTQMTERGPAPPGAMSDSGTSASSILDWTPSQVQRPTYVPNPRVIKPDLRLIPRTPVLRGHSVAVKHGHDPESDTSAASHLDWHSNDIPIEVKDFQMLDLTQKAKTFPILEKVEQPINTKPSSKIPSPILLVNPKLRKQQTVINLKESNGKPVQAQSEKTVSVTAKPMVDVSVPGPRMSDPGPSILRSPNIPSIKEAIREEDLQLPLAPPSIPRSSNTPTTRRSSQLKGIMSLPQMRSGSTAGSQSMYTIEDVIRIECAAICTHIDVGFEEQKGWLQGFMREQNWYVQRLEEENRLFREELAKLRKG